jgi:hypothetical protein
MLRKLAFLTVIIAALGLDALAQGAAQPPKAGQPAQPPQEEPPPSMAVPPSYKYDVRGRRDPFVNPVPKPVAPPPAIPVVRPPGLRGVLAAEAQIKGIVVSREAPELTRAVINAPGGKTYFARIGDALFDAVVKDIRRDGVVFDLRTQDREGKTTMREVVRTINPKP